MKVSKEARSARDIVYDIQKASECIRQDNVMIDRLFEELQALVDGPKTEPANDTPDVVQKTTIAAMYDHDHNHVQHRDDLVPWCDVCFETAVECEPGDRIYPPGYKGERS